MLKTIAQSLTTLLFVVATHTYALPIIQADAFSAGDNKAILDTTTQLTWLDFGINKGNSFNDVMSQLSTTYLGWRLPTESEVRNLWSELFTGTISTDEQYEICDLWGANKTPREHTPFQAYGNFIDDNGYLGHASFLEIGNVLAPGSYAPDRFYTDGTIEGGVYAGSGVKYDGSNYTFSWTGIEEISTLLVRDNTNSTKVPEPSTAILFVLGLFALLMRRRSIAK